MRVRDTLAVSLVCAALACGLCLGMACGKDPSHAPIPGIQIIRPPHEVSALVLRDGELLAGGKGGVFRIDRRTGALLGELKAPFSLRYTRALLVDSQGILWVGSFYGLFAFDGKAWTTHSKKEGFPDDRVNCLLLDHSGRVWVGTWGGAAVREKDRWRTLTSKDGLLDDMVNTILEDRDGGFWFGSAVAPRGGLSLFKDGAWKHFSSGKGLPHNNLNALFQDAEGGVWACTGLMDRGGACRFTKGPTGWTVDRVLTKSDGLAGEKARSVCQDRDGILWIGSEYDGMARGEAGRWRILTEADGLSGAETKAILQDAEGVLWFATNDGVTRLSEEAIKALRTASNSETP